MSHYHPALSLHESRMAAASAALSEAALREPWAAGREMAFDEALEETLAWLERTGSAPGPDSNAVQR